eukprot:3595686-Amphidinium_carterae.1
MQYEYMKQRRDMHDDKNKQIVKDIKEQLQHFNNDINHYINKLSQHDDKYETKFNKKKKAYEEHKKEDTTWHHRHRNITETKIVYNDMMKRNYKEGSATRDTRRTDSTSTRNTKIVQVQEGAEEIPQVDSSTTSSTLHSGSGQVQPPENSEEHYWDNILEYMKLNYNDENLISVAQELHAGVLYNMELDEIED